MTREQIRAYLEEARRTTSVYRQNAIQLLLKEAIYVRVEEQAQSIYESEEILKQCIQRCISHSCVLLQQHNRNESSLVMSMLLLS